LYDILRRYCLPEGPLPPTVATPGLPQTAIEESIRLYVVQEDDNWMAFTVNDLSDLHEAGLSECRLWAAEGGEVNIVEQVKWQRYLMTIRFDVLNCLAK
jgi:hypothetical protein